MRLLITGASGFIGSAFIRNWAEWKMSIDKPDEPAAIDSIVGFARRTSDWAFKRLQTREIQQLTDNGLIRMVYGDLNGDISGLCEGVDAVVNFAAKTFVDHSIRDPGPFIESNTVGALRLLEEARRQKVKAFINISTDEVYGQILTGAYTETAAINPRNPYAASKAGADALTIAHHHTFGMWTAVTRTENNYGQFQHPQKALPVFTAKALSNQPIPVYGDGGHIRQWLHVSDHVRAVMFLLKRWQDLPGGEVWHVAGSQELTNTELATKICKILKKPTDLITYIDDMNIRPGHDRRYALNCDKMHTLGWKPLIGLDEGIEHTVKWYRDNMQWLGC